MIRLFANEPFERLALSFVGAQVLNSAKNEMLRQCFTNPRNNIEANLLPLRLEQRHVLNDPAGSSVKGRLNLHI